MLQKSETNNAIITKLANVREHSNADRLKLATVLGTQVIVGMDAKNDDLIVYFDSNLHLSHEYLYYNNLYSNKEMNADPTQKGYFGRNGRVRAQRFRGEVSNGYVAGLSSIDDIAIATGIVDNNRRVYPSFSLKEGDEFTHINGIEICSKYIVPVKSGGGRGGNKRAKINPVDSDMFWKHWDTKQLMREKDRIGLGTIYVEEKIHGTSGRIGRVLCHIRKPWWKVWGPKEEWRAVSGTRRVDNIEAHMSEERKAIEAKLAPHLHQGEQLYYEIYGYSGNGKVIQSAGGHQFVYDCVYSSPTQIAVLCLHGESVPLSYKVMLYRVTITTPDGFCFDLDREQVYRRAEELGLEKPYLLNKFPETIITEDEDPVEVVENKCDMIIEFAKGKSALDANTMREGIVVWFKDKDGKWDCLKYKSEEFLIRESKQKDEEIGDIEDNL